LSGGERARLCMAGLLLSDFNILILDEPGNHLDVDTVEALAEALVEYEGTVIFTSHDRHFMKRVATNIIEVRDGRVTNYIGQYETYLDKVNSEIEAGERDLANEKKKLPPEVLKPSNGVNRAAQKGERELRKELKILEKSIASLDEQKRTANSELMRSTDAKDAMRLHNEVSSLTEQLSKAEERWCEIQEELEVVV